MSERALAAMTFVAFVAMAVDGVAIVVLARHLRLLSERVERLERGRAR